MNDFRPSIRGSPTPFEEFDFWPENNLFGEEYVNNNPCKNIPPNLPSSTSVLSRHLQSFVMCPAGRVGQNHWRQQNGCRHFQLLVFDSF
jgi:hypothetical protein